MKLKVLGSGSKGNCYLLESKEEILIIELGIPFKDIMQAIDFKIDKVVGCLVSHEHGDHAKSVPQALQRGLRVLCTKGTFDKVYSEKSYFHKELKYRQEYRCGNFYIATFRTEHDAAEPCGFIIRHEKMGSMLFATDTYYVEYRFQNINHWLVECNYSKGILDCNVSEGHIHARLADRLKNSHFELGNVKEFFRCNNLQQTQNIVLLHLSDGNSDAAKFKREIQEVSNKNTYIADKDLEINLNLIPF